MERRFLILSAGMGAGHDEAAGELARRLRARGDRALVLDVLTLLPPAVGPALRAGYRASVRYLPRLYEAIYGAFLAPGQGTRPGVSPLAALAERRLMDRVNRWRPDAVVSTFHLAAHITGRLRARSILQVPAAVFVIDFAVHRGWLHSGNDLYLCVSDAAAEAARKDTGRPAHAPGPVVAPRFGAVPAELGAPWRTLFRQRAPGRPPVLVSSGAWGVGPGLEATARELSCHGCLPVLLCGRDGGLRRRAARLPGVLPLGWVADMPGLMSAARALVDNAAGQTAVQALAAELPVIGYRPIPGHGAEGVREMAVAGLTAYAANPGQLRSALTKLLEPGRERDRRIALGKSAFKGDAAQLIADIVPAR